MARQEIIYDEWLPYEGYEKQECDIKLESGRIIYHCYPNAGEFNTMCGGDSVAYVEERVVEIMYRKYYLEDLCGQDCPGPVEEVEIDMGMLPVAQETTVVGGEGLWSDYADNYVVVHRTEQYIRETPKIERNQPCPCGSGKKHKKCCINN